MGRIIGLIPSPEVAPRLPEPPRDEEKIIPEPETKAEEPVTAKPKPKKSAKAK